MLALSRKSSLVAIGSLKVDRPIVLLVRLRVGLIRRVGDLKMLKLDGVEEPGCLAGLDKGSEGLISSLRLIGDNNGSCRSFKSSSVWCSGSSMACRNKGGLFMGV